MKIMLSVPRPDDGVRLTAAAPLAWQDFNSAMTNPLGKCEVMCGVTDMDANAIAASERRVVRPPNVRHTRLKARAVNQEPSSPDEYLTWHLNTHRTPQPQSTPTSQHPPNTPSRHLESRRTTR